MIDPLERRALLASAVSSVLEVNVPRQQFAVEFDANVSSTLSATTLQALNLRTGQTVTLQSPNYDPVTDIARWSIAGAQPYLANGNYELLVDADTFTPALSSEHRNQTFFLRGDFNRDRAVNYDDPLIYSANSNSSGRTYSQGDSNYDGVVNWDDYLALTAVYGSTMTPAPSASTGLVADGAGTSSTTIQWNYPYDPAVAGFTIFRSSDGTNFLPIGDGYWDTEPLIGGGFNIWGYYEDASLTDGTKYWYRVRPFRMVDHDNNSSTPAVRELGLTTTKDWAVTTMKAPTDIDVQMSGDMALVSWTDRSASETGYTITATPVDASGNPIAGALPIVISAPAVAGTNQSDSAILEGLTENTRYLITVKGFNSVHESAPASAAPVDSGVALDEPTGDDISVYGAASDWGVGAASCVQGGRFDFEWSPTTDDSVGGYTSGQTVTLRVSNLMRHTFVYGGVNIGIINSPPNGTPVTITLGLGSKQISEAVPVGYLPGPPHYFPAGYAGLGVNSDDGISHVGEELVVTVKVEGLPTGATWFPQAAGFHAAIPAITLVGGTTVEGAEDPGGFTLTRTGNINKPLSVNVGYYPVGRAVTYADYNIPATTIDFSIGERTRLLPVTTYDDRYTEGPEWIDGEVKFSSRYMLGDPNTARVLIWDNDAGTGGSSTLGIPGLNPPGSPTPPTDADGDGNPDSSRAWIDVSLGDFGWWHWWNGQDPATRPDEQWYGSTEDGPGLTTGGVLRLNSDFDESYDETGTYIGGDPPAYDYEVDGIIPTDGEVAPLWLGMWTDTAEGDWTLTWDASKVKLWVPVYATDPETGFQVFDHYEAKAGGSWSGTTEDAYQQGGWWWGYGISAFVEPIKASVSIDDVSFVAKLTPSDGGAVADTANASVFELQLDVDSDNNNSFDPPDHSAVEDLIDSHPLDSNGKKVLGKLAVVNDGDLDGDGVLDYSDGFNADGIPNNADDAPPTQTQGAQFVPVVIDLPEPIDLSKARLQIAYDANTPGSGPGGQLRLWTKDGNRIRSMLPVTTTGGSFVPAKSGSEFYSGADLAALGFTSGHRKVTLFLEAIAPSADAGLAHVSISIDPDGSGPAGFALSDSVRLSPIRVDLDVDNNGIVDDVSDRTVNYLPGYVGGTGWRTPVLSTGTTFNSPGYVGQQMAIIVEGLGSGTVVDGVFFDMPDVSAYPGFAWNGLDPSLEYEIDDFSFSQNANGRSEIGTMAPGRTTVPIWCKDYGGWANVDVVATIGSLGVRLRRLSLTNDTDADTIADTWEREKVAEWNTQYGFTLSETPARFAPSDDIELQDPDGTNTDGGTNMPPQKTSGDGIQIWQEYRGYILDGGGHDPNGANAHAGGHKRLSPSSKEMLVEADVMSGVTGMPSLASLHATMNEVSAGFSDSVNGMGFQMYWLMDDTAAPHLLYADDDALIDDQIDNRHALLDGFVPLRLADEQTGDSSLLGLTPPQGGSTVLVGTIHGWQPTLASSIVKTTIAHELYHNVLDAAGAPGFMATQEHVDDGNSNGTPGEPADVKYLMYPVADPSVSWIWASDADRRQVDFTTSQMVQGTGR